MGNPPIYSFFFGFSSKSKYTCCRCGPFPRAACRFHFHFGSLKFTLPLQFRGISSVAVQTSLQIQKVLLQVYRGDIGNNPAWYIYIYTCIHTCMHACISLHCIEVHFISFHCVALHYITLDYITSIHHTPYTVPHTPYIIPHTPYPIPHTPYPYTIHHTYTYT